ncbi:hypothetical protein Y032_0067g108 [Ancylostoma ceylanicum]|uniref:Uncharacterized protein n=1 Tax=Ancylostoma ceylanicum TaxID=53326 RepID=A0A016TZT9_9BILA|nr:hypothetical protein Y032_0067g108 [Ancylostoma ceylanicum]
MKLAIALSIAIASVAIAKPTPRNDPESSEEGTSITPNHHAYHRRHTAPLTTTVDITVGAKTCSTATSLSTSPLFQNNRDAHHRRHTGTPTTTAEKSTSILEDVEVTEHPDDVRTRAVDVVGTDMMSEEVTDAEAVFTSGNTDATVEVVTVRS